MKKITYVVQNKHLHDPDDWYDHSDYSLLVDARKWADILRKINPNVRVIKRTITERVIR